MRARFVDPNHLDATTHEQVFSPDVYTCPLSCRYFRHPVLAGDRRRYELKELLRYVEEGFTESPVRAGDRNGDVLDVFPIIYDAQWKNELDEMIGEHPERYEDYDADELLNKLNSVNTDEGEPVDANGTPVHIAIGKSMLVMFFVYMSISALIVLLTDAAMPRSFKSNETLRSAFTYSSLLAIWGAFVYHERRVRMENDNEYGLLGAVANQYYSLFKRPQRQTHVLPPPQPRH